MELQAIETGNLKLDGGAMFGVIPKTLWNAIYPADENNRINLSMRCLLLTDGDKCILIDNGIGDKQGEKFFNFYDLNGDHSLAKSLHKAGLDFPDITDVVLTHLHFDHCGGSVKRSKDKNSFELSFPNASYWVTKAQWEWATKPNPREKASFLKENILPLEESGQLTFIQADTLIHPSLSFFTANGHTDGQAIPLIRHKNNTLAFCADLIPTAAHVPLVYVMGYDTRPLLTMEEKQNFLATAANEKYILFYEHDIRHECGFVEMTEKGYRSINTCKLQDAC